MIAFISLLSVVFLARKLLIRTESDPRPIPGVRPFLLLSLFNLLLNALYLLSLLNPSWNISLFYRLDLTLFGFMIALLFLFLHSQSRTRFDDKKSLSELILFYMIGFLSLLFLLASFTRFAPPPPPPTYRLAFYYGLNRFYQLWSSSMTILFFIGTLFLYIGKTFRRVYPLHSHLFLLLVFLLFFVKIKSFLFSGVYLSLPVFWGIGIQPFLYLLLKAPLPEVPDPEEDEDPDDLSEKEITSWESRSSSRPAVPSSPVNPPSMAVLSSEKKILRLNSPLALLLGYPPAEILNTSLNRYIHRDDLPGWEEFFSVYGKDSASRETSRFSLRLRDHRQKKDRLTELSLFPLPGEPFRIFALFQDTFKQEKMLKALKLSQYQNFIMAENIDEIFWLASADYSRIFRINSAVRRILGVSPESIKKDPQSLYRFFGSDFTAALLKEKEMEFSVKKSGTKNREEQKWLWIRSKQIRNSSGRLIGHAGVGIDITERKRVELLLNDLSVKDPLTNLYNRRYFFRVLRRELRRSVRYQTPMTLVLLDIDHFKNINDTRGHDSGDQVLKDFAKFCLTACRDIDTVVRFGGEEFMIIMPETASEGALVMLERFRKKLRSLRIGPPKSKPIQFTISAGIVSNEHDLENAEPDENVLIKKADTALYASKRTRDTLSVWNEEMGLPEKATSSDSIR